MDADLGLEVCEVNNFIEQFGKLAKKKYQKKLSLSG
jgi:hypothetical protein